MKNNWDKKNQTEINKKSKKRETQNDEVWNIKKKKCGRTINKEIEIENKRNLKSKKVIERKGR